MSDITTTEIVIAAVGASATIIGGIWAAWTYFDSRAAKAREDARATLAEEKAAWKELADFHKLSGDVLSKAAMLRAAPDEFLVEEFLDLHQKWLALHEEKKGLLGRKGRERASHISEALTNIGLHHMPSSIHRFVRFGLKSSEDLWSLRTRISRDPTYFIH